MAPSPQMCSAEIIRSDASIKRQKAILAFVASAVALYVVLLPCNDALYSLLLFPLPDPRTPDIGKRLGALEASGIGVKKLQFCSANGRKLRGFLFTLPNTRRIFLYSHAKGNNIYGKIHVAQNLLACGGSVLMYDYQGYGMSEGRSSIENACNDVIAAYDYLQKVEGRNSNEIIAFGESFGCGVTGQLVEHRKVGGVILHSGFSSLIDAGRATLPWLWLYPDWTFPHQNLDAVAVFKKPHPPLLLIHGKADVVTSYKNSLAIYNAAAPPKSLVILPDVGHCSFGKANEAIIAIKEFLKRNQL